MVAHRCKWDGFTSYWVFDNGWGAGVVHTNSLNGVIQNVLAIPEHVMVSDPDTFSEYVNSHQSEGIECHTDSELTNALVLIMNKPPHKMAEVGIDMLDKFLMERRK